MILSEFEVKQLEQASRTMWEAMNRLIEIDGYSDLTLHLEGSYYEIREIIQKTKGEIGEG